MHAARTVVDFILEPARNPRGNQSQTLEVQLWRIKTGQGSNWARNVKQASQANNEEDK